MCSNIYEMTEKVLGNQEIRIQAKLEILAGERFEVSKRQSLYFPAFTNAHEYTENN